MTCIIWNSLVIIVNYNFNDKCLIISLYTVQCFVYVIILGSMFIKHPYTIHLDQSEVFNLSRVSYLSFDFEQEASLLLCIEKYRAQCITAK